MVVGSRFGNFRTFWNSQLWCQYVFSKDMFLRPRACDTDRISANHTLPLASSCATFFHISIFAFSSGFHLAGALLAASMAWLVLAPGGRTCAWEKLVLMDCQSEDTLTHFSNLFYSDCQKRVAFELSFWKSYFSNGRGYLKSHWTTIRKI